MKTKTEVFRIIKLTFFIILVFAIKAKSQTFTTYYDFLDYYYTNYVFVPDTFERGEETLIERDAFIWAPRIYPNPVFDDAHAANYDYTMGFNSYGRFGGGSCPFLPSLPATWNQLGPVTNGTNVPHAGQIHRLIFHPLYDAVTNMNMYASSGFGGLWKSSNSAASWTLMNTDNTLPFCGVADVSVSYQGSTDWIYIATGYPDGTLYGTVSPNTNSVNPIFTQGVYRTNNDGGNWEPVDGGLMIHMQNGGVIRRLISEPTNPDNVIIASSEGFFVSNNATSITPSWTQGTLSGSPLIDPQMRGLEFSPATSTTLYGSGSDVYQSLDGGLTWNSISGTGTGLDFAVLFSNYGGFIPQRINICTYDDPVNGVIVYAYIVGLNSKCFIFEFTEGTGMWSQKLYHNTTALNAVYDQTRNAVSVDPRRPDLVYWGHTQIRNANMSLTTPVVNTFMDYDYTSPGRYVDVHTIAFDPILDQVFVAHDGGISKFTFSTSLWQFCNVGFCNNIIWSFDDNEVEHEDMIAAFQDQGVKTFQDIGGTKKWYSAYPYGDGYSSRIYDDINKLSYHSPGHGVLQHYNFNTQVSGQIGSGFPTDIPDPGGIPIYFSKTFSTELHPFTHKPYSGFSEIYSQNVPFLSSWELESDIGKTAPAKWTRQITELAISRSNPDIVFAIISGIDNGTDPLATWNLNPRLFKSTTGFQDGVTNWATNHFHEINLLTAGIPPYTGNTILPVLSGIAINPSNPDNVYITFTGYSKHHKVFRSDDGGVTWINWDPNNCLLNLPVNGIVYQDGTDDRLYIATDLGVFTRDNVSDWVEYGDLPNVRCVELKINNCNNSLKVATFGRGIFEADLLPASGLNSDLIVESNTTWTVDRFETGNIRINNGATLTIQSKLMMPYMGKIEVENGSTLYLNGGIITNNCDKMWDGIYLEDIGSVFTMDNSGTIENSVNGVNSFNGAPITTSGNSIFNKNLYSIKLHPFAGTNPLNVSATTFTCVDGSSLPTLLNYPFNTQRSSVAVNIDQNTDVSIGDITSINNKNYFFNHDYGIVSRTSNLRVVNAGFELIDDNINPEDPILFSGSAIYSVATKPTPTTLIVGGYTPIGGNNTSEVTFKNCKRSVLAYDHVSTDIQYTKSENITLNSIDLQFTYFMPHFIDHNDFVEANVGINIFKCENSGLLTISNNNYFLAPYSGSSTYLRRGIYIDNVIPSNCNLNISGNRIDGARIGIRLRHINDGTVIQNVIYPQTSGGTASKFGIYLTRCLRSRVIQNGIFRVISIPIQRIESMRGIRIDGCQGSIVHKNTTLGMGKGHYCFGNNSDTYYYCNIMDDCIEGIFMEAATLPSQGAATTMPSDNQWKNMGANIRINETAPTGNAFVWYHRGIFNDPFNDFSPGPWISFGITASQTTGDGPCGLPDGQDPPKSREQSFGNIVTDSTQYTWLEDENRYFDKNFLLATIENDSTFINQGLPYDPLYNLFRLNNEESNFSFFNQVESLTNSGDILSANTLNQSIIDTNLIEFNKKQVLNIYLQSLAVGDSSLDSAQIVNLQQIAWQTLAEGGDGVAMARSMLHLEIDDEFGTSFRSSVTNVKSEDQVIICYPNPASNNMLITRTFDNGVVYQISLMNTIGEIVTIEKFSSKNYLLKLGDLRSGSYLIKITDKNNVICSKTIIKL